jgi:hypothetical protein
MDLRTVFKLGISTLVISLALAVPALAQSAATLTGTVISEQRDPVAHAVVTADGNGLRLVRQTDERGHFAFEGLPVGTYRVSASTGPTTAYASVDLSSAGASLTLQLLKTLGAVNSVSVPLARGSGTDVVLNQVAIAHSPAYASVPNLLLQLPGAARGANGIVHINGDHGDINYVVDGVPVPQALNREIGSEIDPADISFMDVLEGAYPAQYGGRFAAVVNIDTKASIGPPGVNGYVSGGSNAAYDSDFDYHTPIGKGSLVLAARAQRSARALDPPNFTAVHDNGSDLNQFVRYALPLDNDFLLASVAHSYQTFQIPNDVAGGEPANTDDNETQDDTFANVQYHHTLRSNGAVTYGGAFKRSRIRDTNDPQNDFTYGEALNLASGGSPDDCSNGVVSACGYSLFSDRTARDFILNLDASIPSARHAIRYGASYDATNVQKYYAVTLQPQNFISPSAATVADNAPNVAHTENAYLQDTWQMGPLWRVDYGVRLDAFQVFSDQFDRGFSQLSPRLKITRLYGPRASVYLYAGRFFTPFSFENVSPAAAQQLDAPLQPTIAQFDLRPQRDTDVEIGGTAPLGPGELGIRVMQKVAVDLIDDTQVGVTALHQDINYARGNISSQSAYYQQSLSRLGRVYLSLTHTRAVNKGCETQLLAPCFGAPDDWTPADHDQRWDAAGGVTLNDARGGWFSLDGEYGSGLSSGYCEPADDNCKVPPHTTFDLEKGVAVSNGMVLTLGIRNIFNDRYLITYLNAQGNHYDAGRTFTFGLRFASK